MLGAITLSLPSPIEGEGFPSRSKTRWLKALARGFLDRHPGRRREPRV